MRNRRGQHSLSVASVLGLVFELPSQERTHQAYLNTVRFVQDQSVVFDGMNDACVVVSMHMKHIEMCITYCPPSRSHHFCSNPSTLCDGLTQGQNLNNCKSQFHVIAHLITYKKS